MSVVNSRHVMQTIVMVCTIVVPAVLFRSVMVLVMHWMLDVIVSVVMSSLFFVVWVDGGLLNNMFMLGIDMASVVRVFFVSRVDMMRRLMHNFFMVWIFDGLVNELFVMRGDMSLMNDLSMDNVWLFVMVSNISHGVMIDFVILMEFMMHIVMNWLLYYCRMMNDSWFFQDSMSVMRNKLNITVHFLAVIVFRVVMTVAIAMILSPLMMSLSVMLEASALNTVRSVLQSVQLRSMVRIVIVWIHVFDDSLVMVHLITVVWVSILVVIMTAIVMLSNNMIVVLIMILWHDHLLVMVIEDLMLEEILCLLIRVRILIPASVLSVAVIAWHLVSIRVATGSKDVLMSMMRALGMVSWVWITIHLRLLNSGHTLIKSVRLSRRHLLSRVEYVLWVHKFWVFLSP